MRCWRYWEPATAALVLLLCVAEVDTEHLKAEKPASASPGGAEHGAEP